MADAQEGRPLGRNTKLTPETIRAVTAAIGGGAYFKDACRHAGVHEATAYRWLAHAEDPAPRLAEYARPADWRAADERHDLACEFRDATKKAEASSKVAALARIQRAGRNGTWQADAWFLERKYPAEFGRRIVEVGGAADSGPVRVEVNTATLEQLLADPELRRAATSAARAQQAAAE